MSEVTSTNALVKDSTMQTLNSKLDTLNTTLGGNTNIAPVFNIATAYTKGDMVYYNNDLYVFTSNHSAGAWTGNDVVQTKVSTELASLKSGLISVTEQANKTVYQNTDRLVCFCSVEGAIIIMCHNPTLGKSIGINIALDGSITRYEESDV